MASMMKDQISSIRQTLQAIEGQILDGKVPAEGLEDFKSAVDDIRLRVWAIMSAGNLADGPGALKRFRLRRLMELMNQVTEDLTTGSTAVRRPELEQARGAAQRFLNQIETTSARTF